jgi:zinc D-Ala-D-Ala carboxypeptidase
VPSHRADTPADAPTVTSTLPAPRTAAQSPHQRRRDLRGHGRTTTPKAHAPASALAWLEATEQSRASRPAPARGTAPLSRREVHRRIPAAASMVVLDRGEIGALPLGPLPVSPRSPEAEPPVEALLPEPPAPRTSSPAEDLPPWPLDVPEPAAERAAGPVRRASSTGRARRTAGAAPALRRPAISLPQAGIAGALGLATIAVPLTGAFAVAPPVKPVANTMSTAALTPLPPFPLATIPARTALDDVRLLPDEEPTASVPARLAAPRTLLVGRASRSNERAVLPGCDGGVPSVAGIQNGQLPASMLCTLWDPRRQLRSDAAVAIAKLNLGYEQHFGHGICFSDAYRSLSAQYRVKAERGSFAARPGTSEHGWGLAVDLCDGVEQGPSSLSYQWMRTNAARYGWQNPNWARSGGSGPYEPWHWEYVSGEKGQSSGD